MPRLSRRDVLKVGSVAPLGLVLPQLLRAETPTNGGKVIETLV